MRSTVDKSVAVGFFDGVHLGHRRIFERAGAALTFRNHPLSLLDKARAPRLIMSAEERIAAIRACGVEKIVMLDFTRELASLPPGEFIAKYIVGLGGSKVFCGEDWRFGRGGSGDADFLRKAGIEVEVVPYAFCDGERISSSRIRSSLEGGEVSLANRMLGRRFKVKGSVFSGKGAGRLIGFPTVNIAPEGLELFLPLGVYEVIAGGKRAIANYGMAPTMGEYAWKRPVLEVHLPEAPQEDISEVELVEFVRPERKFASLEDLRRQIAEDFGRIAK